MEKLKLAFLVLCLSLMATGAAMAQQWSGPTSLGIEVREKSGKPLVGARVLLQYAEVRPFDGPPASVTDDQGRVEVIHLAEGRWRIDVQSEGRTAYTVVVRIEPGKKPAITAGPIRDAVVQPLKVQFAKSPKALGSSPASTQKAKKKDDKKSKRNDRGRSSNRRGRETAQKPKPAKLPAPREEAKPAAEPQPTTAAPERAQPAPAKPVAPKPEPTQPEMPAKPTPDPVVPPKAQAPKAQTPKVAKPETQKPPTAQPSTPVVETSIPETSIPKAPQPKPIQPKPVVEPKAPEVRDPKPSIPKTNIPKTSIPKTSAQKPEPPKPTIPEPTPAKPEPAKPEPAKPEPAKPMPVPSPEPAKPAPMPVEPTKPPVDKPSVPETPTEPMAQVESTPPPTAVIPTPAAPSKPAVPTPVPQADEEVPAEIPAVEATPSGLASRQRTEIRSFTEPSCPGCKPGEWALIVEQEVAAATSRKGCPGNADKLHDTLRTVADSAGTSLGTYKGPILDLTDATQRSTIAPFMAAEGACQVIAAALPQGTRFAGYGYEVRDSTSGGNCQADQDCSIGLAKWLGHPSVVKSDESSLVYGIFENRSTERPRTARLILYFKAPKGWRPPR
ncbi:MAG: hypothetical protein K0U98_24175 [Deltaproteobacteria bacterium]|nr:hypothetical protein [Deltaproteobacteria bacterium]